MNTLFIVSTPIGNLDDISFRAIETLKSVSIVFAEDTRRSSKLFSHFEIKTPLRPYHEHNVQDAIPEVLFALQSGDVALISDSGTPLISDPGFKLVRDARKSGFIVNAIPGASAVLSALVSSGLPTDKFSFRGFLPKKSSQMEKEFETIRDREETTIYYESPFRIQKTLDVISKILGENRIVSVCRELTKMHEEVQTASAGELQKLFSSRKPKGEFVVLIAKSEYSL